MNNAEWVSWFLAVCIPGQALEVGLQSELHLAFAFCIAATAFIIVLGIAVAEAMEFIAIERERHSDPTADLEWHSFESEMDQELNGR